jgi:hypothetical protein
VSQSFRFILKIFSQYPLNGGGGSGTKKFFFHRSPNPFSAAFAESGLEDLASLVPCFETEGSGLRLTALAILPVEAVGVGEVDGAGS